MSALSGVSNWLARNQPFFSASSTALVYIPKPFSAFGVSTTLAPRNRISRRRSTEKVSTIVTTSG